MDKEEAERDWIAGPLAPDAHYHRVEFVMAELRDFGRDVGIQLKDEHNWTYCPAMSREQVQKLFDKLWEFYFRPTGGPDGF